jgi:molybdopterin converting factor small subunit
MPVTIYIPTPFRRATGARDRLEVAAATVGAALDALEREYEDLRGLLRDERGSVHHHVNIYVNSAAIEELQGLETGLHDGDEVAIIPALAGGARRPGVDRRDGPVATRPPARRGRR